jgi:hypothetical protein
MLDAGDQQGKRSWRLRASGGRETAGRALVWQEKRLTSLAASAPLLGRDVPRSEGRGSSLLFRGESPTAPAPTIGRAMRHEKTAICRGRVTEIKRREPCVKRPPTGVTGGTGRWGAMPMALSCLPCPAQPPLALIPGSGVEEEALSCHSRPISMDFRRSRPMRPPRDGAGVRFPARLHASPSKRRSARPSFAPSCGSRWWISPGSRALISRFRGMIRTRRSSAASAS